MMIIDDLVKIKGQWGKHISGYAKAFAILLFALTILKFGKIIDVHPYFFSTLLMLLIGCVFINYSPEIKNYIKRTDFTSLRIKFFNNAHRLDKIMVLLIITPIWLLFSYVMTKALYIEAIKEISTTGAVSFLLCFCSISLIIFYVLVVKRKRPFLIIRSGIFEGIFKPSMIKNNDQVTVISDDERNQYSGIVISKESNYINQLKIKEVFKKRFELPFSATPTCFIDIGFGMYIDAPLDRITIDSPGKNLI